VSIKRGSFQRATCKDFLQVQKEGSRKVKRAVKYYNLKAITAVGYRVIQDMEYLSDFDKLLLEMENRND
jgi:hypothetical protein